MLRTAFLTCPSVPGLVALLFLLSKLLHQCLYLALQLALLSAHLLLHLLLQLVHPDLVFLHCEVYLVQLAFGRLA
jgi:hypothetical protein